MAPKKRTQSATPDNGAASSPSVNLLDVGESKYGDCLLCRLGSVSVLVDGGKTANYRAKNGHPSIPTQLTKLLAQEKPLNVDLLITTHVHEDHIGCLPELVSNGVVTAKFALVADPDFRWGIPRDYASIGPKRRPDMDPRAYGLREALREEYRAEDTDDDLRTYIDAQIGLEERYRGMLQRLATDGCKVIRHGTDDPQRLLTTLSKKGVRLAVLGPRKEDLEASHAEIEALDSYVVATINSRPATYSQIDTVRLYRELISADMYKRGPSEGTYLNLQSIVAVLAHEDVKILLTGDCELADPETSNETLRSGVKTTLAAIAAEAPYQFVKLPHHGSWNGTNAEVWKQMGQPALVGMCGGKRDPAHPAKPVLNLLEENSARTKWVRTDHNGLVRLGLAGTPDIRLSAGEVNDAEPNHSYAVLTYGAVGRVESVRLPLPAAGNGHDGRPIEVRAQVSSGASKRITVTVELD